MKLRALITLCVGALLAVSAATAAPPPGKGKPPTTGANCRPQIAVILTGKLAADAGTAPTALSVNVTGGNKHGRAYKKAAQPVSVALTATTKVNRAGDHNAADLKSGDRVNIQARACKADLANDATPALTAVRVTAHATS